MPKAKAKKRKERKNREIRPDAKALAKKDREIRPDAKALAKTYILNFFVKVAVMKLRGPFKEKAIILIIQPQGTYCVFFKAESKNLENF